MKVEDETKWGSGSDREETEERDEEETEERDKKESESVR